MKRRVSEALGTYTTVHAAPVVLVDVNVLVAATRPEHVHHATAHAALQQRFDANATFGVATHLLAALVRICTNPKIFAQPTTPAAAFEVAEHYRSYAHAVRIEPGLDHWRLFRSLVLNTPLSGAATSDAWHAALAMEHSCEWWTFDHDFSPQRFPGLRVRLLPK